MFGIAHCHVSREETDYVTLPRVCSAPESNKTWWEATMRLMLDRNAALCNSQTSLSFCHAAIQVGWMGGWVVTHIGVFASFCLVNGHSQPPSPETKFGIA